MLTRSPSAISVVVCGVVLALSCGVVVLLFVCCVVLFLLCVYVCDLFLFLQVTDVPLSRVKVPPCSPRRGSLRIRRERASPTYGDYDEAPLKGKNINRSHTHTDREQHPRHRHTHTHTRQEQTPKRTPPTST